MNYRLNLRIPYLMFSPFKDKECHTLINFINACRIGEEIQFDSFGTVEPNDRQWNSITVSSQNEYDPKTSNCLIYNMKNTNWNNGDYDKLFIYQTVGKEISNYGFMFLNTETNKEVEVHTLEYSDDVLIHRITEYMHKIPTYSVGYWDKIMGKTELNKMNKKKIKYA